MQERHINREKYFEEQNITTSKYVVPFISEVKPFIPGDDVLEVGCGEGGNLMPFLDLGCNCVGVDIACNKIENGRSYFGSHKNYKNLNLLCQDIFTWETDKKFDVIFLRDVLEHLPARDKFLEKVRTLLKPNGIVFLGFPPWQNPFGGHQQICENKKLSKAAFIHLLPKSIYKWILFKGGESDAKVKSLMEIWDTRISIGHFKRLVKKANFKIDKKTLYLINPNYETKFGLKPRKQLLGFVPYLRNFIVTTCYYVISPK